LIIRLLSEMKETLLVESVARKDTSHVIFGVVDISKLEFLEYQHSY